MNSKKMILQTMLTTELPIHFPTVISELQAIPAKAFIGLEIIISKSIQVNVPYYLAIKVPRLHLLIEYK